jgi:serine/threonine protein kinase
MDFIHTKSFCGSYAYLAPEMVKKAGHGKAVDWYLLGVLIFEMLTGIPPYYDNDREVLFFNIVNQDLELPKNISKEAKDLLKKLLHKSPSKRLGAMRGASEIKAHPWFKGVNWQDVYDRKVEPPIPYLKRKVKKGDGQVIIEVPDDLHKERRQLEEDQNFISGWSFIKPV